MTDTTTPSMPTNTYKMRREHDCLGFLDLPADALYGIHAARALLNQPIAAHPVHSRLVRAYALVKQAAARVNARLGLIPAVALPAIEQACSEMAAGSLGIPAIDAYQGGAGTSTNLAVTEVLCNRALVLMGEKPGNYQVLSPTDHLNRSQSTNDTYPSALRVAALFALKDLEAGIVAAQDACHALERQFGDQVCLGRTEGMDAVLITMGRRFGAWAGALGRDRWRIAKCAERLRLIPLGGTAVGTGIGAPRDYIFQACDELRRITGLPLARAEDLMDGIANQDALVEVHGILSAFASSLMKICGDLRFLNSGPHGGIGEIHLPPRQAGSSIMPGKINPVVPEAVTQAALRVLANHGLLSQAAGLGQLELNPFAPLIAETLLESLDLLTKASTALAKDAFTGLTVDAARCAQNANAETAIATALVGELGYELASEIVQKAHEKQISLQEASGIDAASWKRLTSAANVLRLGDRVREGF